MKEIHVILKQILQIKIFLSEVPKDLKFWQLLQYLILSSPTIYMILNELKWMMVKNFRHSLLSTFLNLFNAKFKKVSKFYQDNPTMKMP